METTNHLSMHQDHKVWRTENALWVDDLRMWDKEIDELTKQMEHIKQAVDNHVDAYHKHQEQILTQGNRLDQHEQEMAFLEEGSQTDNALIPDHSKENELHDKLRQAHERVKKYHHQVVVVVKGLTKALDQAL